MGAFQTVELMRWCASSTDLKDEVFTLKERKNAYHEHAG